jgi:hypothetical protein
VPFGAVLVVFAAAFAAVDLLLAVVTLAVAVAAVVVLLAAASPYCASVCCSAFNKALLPLLPVPLTGSTPFGCAAWDWTVRLVGVGGTGAKPIKVLLVPKVLIDMCGSR